MSKIQAVCFDMDGILFDSERLGEIIDDQAMALQGLEMNQEIRDHLLGSNFDSCRIFLQGYFGERIDAARFIDDWRRLIREYALTNGVPKKPGADETLRGLKAMGIPIALCTSNGPELVETYLAGAGWSDIFDVIVDGTMVTRGKPDPEIYLEGARRMRVDPTCCAGVEDSMNGLRSVRAAGMYSVMIPDLIQPTAAHEPYVDVCIDTMEKLIPLLFPEG